MADLVLSQLRHMVQSFDTTRSHTRIFPKTYEDVVQVRKQMKQVLIGSTPTRMQLVEHYTQTMYLF